MIMYEYIYIYVYIHIYIFIYSCIYKARISKMHQQEVVLGKEEELSPNISKCKI